MYPGVGADKVMQTLLLLKIVIVNLRQIETIDQHQSDSVDAPNAVVVEKSQQIGEVGVDEHRASSLWRSER